MTDPELRLRLRIRDVVTGVVLLTQTVDDPDLAGAAARYAADRALDHYDATRHPVALELTDPEGDVAPADAWVELGRVTE